jgi:hypothetical protein
VGPSLRTIGRILARRGAVDARQRVRRRPPRLGWYLPEVAAARAEVDRVDLVEGLVIASGPQVEVLKVISLHGGLVGSWPWPGVTATVVTEALREQRSLVDATWPHRRVRAEVDLDQDVIRVYALRRREPMAQPLLRTTPYQSPHKRFRE